MNIIHKHYYSFFKLRKKLFVNVDKTQLNNLIFYFLHINNLDNNNKGINLQDQSFEEGTKGILKDGHRSYIGAAWETIGKLQFDFLLKSGLSPSDILLDIGCGCFRGGQHFIEYLNATNYLGIEKEATLISLGLEKELDEDLVKNKNPELVISSRFEFEKFKQTPNWSIAQSVFTHLSFEDIKLCLEKLYSFVKPGHQFYGTFFEGLSRGNPKQSHSRKNFRFRIEELETLSKSINWSFEYIGEWGHPRNQMMIKLVK